MSPLRSSSPLRRLLDPAFLVALSVLLLNDHVWKQAFHNALTGKLSDFAGLYAFHWVFLILLPGWRRVLPWAVATLFAGWKSPLSEPLLEGWNSLGWMVLDRVVDVTDLLALTMLPVATARLQQMRLRPWQQTFPAWGNWILLVVAVMAFVATSQVERYEFKESYSFSLSPQQLVGRLNALNEEQRLGNPPLSLYHQNANDFREEGDFRLYLHHGRETTTHYDTTFAKVDDSLVVEEVRTYQVPSVDTMYVNPDGIFEWRFDAQAAMADSSGNCRFLPAYLDLKKTSKGCKLKLKMITLINCTPYLAPTDAKPPSALKDAFETSVVKRLYPNTGMD